MRSADLSASSLFLHNIYTNNTLRQLIGEGILNPSVVTRYCSSLFMICVQRNTSHVQLLMSLVTFFPPTEIQAEAESGDHSQKNIGHVFVHRPQQPIPNSWHITAQSYSKRGSADVCCCLFLATDLFILVRGIKEAEVCHFFFITLILPWISTCIYIFSLKMA